MPLVCRHCLFKDVDKFGGGWTLVGRGVGGTDGAKGWQTAVGDLGVAKYADTRATFKYADKYINRLPGTVFRYEG